MNHNGNGYPPPGPYGYPPPQQQYQQPQYQQQQPYYAPPPAPMQVFVQQNAGAVVVKFPFKHTVHVVLDVISCGAWLPIHLICWAVH